MHCARCGATLSPDDERCACCGARAAPVDSAPALLPDSQGIPVARFHPTPSGAPVAPEPYGSAEQAVPFPLPQRARGLRIVPPLPSPSPRRTRLALASSIILGIILALFVAAGLATGVIVLMGALPIPRFPGIGGTSLSPTAPSATATPVCAVTPPVVAAKAALASAQLTTGVRDEQGQDFRPVDNVTTFHAGTRAFITFQIVSQAAGTAAVTFCTPAGIIPGTLAIPAGSSGRYAQFSLLLPPQPLGDCVATLEWNGAVAASLPFTVEQ